MDASIPDKLGEKKAAPAATGYLGNDRLFSVKQPTRVHQVIVMPAFK
jgi:hypothetical protein